MKSYSIWSDFQRKDLKRLSSNINCDVLIIGGGITGCGMYYHLYKNFNTILVEQNKIGDGVTARSTGKLTFMQNDLLDKIRKQSVSKASLYLKSQIDAIKIIKKIIKEENIKCDLEKTDSVIYTNKEEEINKIKDLKSFLSSCDIKVNDYKTDLVKMKYAIVAHDTYIFNPSLFVYQYLKDKNNVYEDTKIIDIKRKENLYCCYTKDHVIKAKYVIIASHYPYFNIPYFLPIKSYLEKSYLLAGSKSHEPISLISYSNPFVSIRTYKNKMIYLSNSLDSYKNIDNSKNFEELLKKTSDIGLFPTYLWTNTDIMTNDNLPYIGKIKKNMFIATGYNTWGLTNGILSGKIISDILLKKKNPYIELFDPKRINLKKELNIILNISKNFLGYMNGFLKHNNHYFCTHMHCPVIYNKNENTYDCPCHGSRFDINGDVIVSPANKNLKIK